MNEIQSIDINTYAEVDKNVKLAEDLMYYDPRYIAYKVPSLNEHTSQGIKLGYFVSSSGGTPSYRVTYNMKIPAVVENIDSLKSDFKAYIPQLAAFHASKSELYEIISPQGREWAMSLFSHSAEDILSGSSNLLRESISTEQFETAIKNIQSEFGTPLSTDFVRAQYYEEFDILPESVSLYYLQTYQGEKKAMVRVSFHQENNKWIVMGFRIEPYV